MAKKNKKQIATQKRIKKLLPHREPFIFIDDIIELKKNKRVVAVKNVRKSEYFLKGHFPGRPIMPGVLITEAAVQAGLILLRTSRRNLAKGDFNCYLLKNTSEFISPICPGDKMIIEVTPIKILYNSLIGRGIIKVKNRTVAKIDFIVIMKKK